MPLRRPRLLIALLVAAVAVVAVRSGWRFSPPNAGIAETSVAPQNPPRLLPPHPREPRATAPPALSRQASDDVAPAADPVLAALRERLQNPRVVAGEALVSFHSPIALEQFSRQAAALDLETLGTVPALHTLRVRYRTLEGLRDALAQSGAEAQVEGNLWLGLPTEPPGPDPANEGGTTPFGQNLMSSLNASGDRTHWGESVTVAVLDSGVLAHPTFGEGQVTHLDLVNDGQPFNSHGTSVASLIGGQNPQAPGVAPGARILDVRVADAAGYTVGSILAEGIIAATDRGAQVINISLGGYGDSLVLRQAVAYATQRGVVLVAAAGNDAYNEVAAPAAYNGVISVASVDARNQQAYFSNSGQGLDLAAPGVGVITAWDTNKIALVSGTSQSSALVAAASAAYLGWGVAPIDVGPRLKTDARPSATPARQVGVGILQIKPPAGR